MLNELLGQFNKRSLFEYDNEVERDYCKLQDLVECNGVDAVYTVEALFINTKSRFGNAPVLVTSQWLVNAPSHLTPTVQQMIQTPELVAQINARKVGFKVYQYTTNNRVCFSVEWVEVTNEQEPSNS